MMADQPALLIAGCGDIGTRLGRVMTGRGWTVYGLRRHTTAMSAMDGGKPFAMMRADLNDPGSLNELPDAECVLYIASADDFSEEAYRRAYVDGLRNLLAATHRHGGERLLLFVSSTGVYGQDDGSWVDESSPTEPRGFNGRIMLEGEAVAAAAPGPCVRVRFSGIYGPGRTRTLRQVRDGLPAPQQPVAWTNRIHTEDCVGVLAHLLQRHHAGQAPASLYLASDDTPAPLAEIHRYLAAELGLRQGGAEGSHPGGSRRAGSKRCSNRRLRDSGYRFRYPDYRAGYRALLDAMANSGSGGNNS